MMRRTRASATTPEHTSAMAAVKGSQVLPPVSGSGRADAEGLAVALAVALADALALALAAALTEALAVAPVLALSSTRRTSRLSLTFMRPHQGLRKSHQVVFSPTAG